MPRPVRVDQHENIRTGRLKSIANNRRRKKSLRQATTPRHRHNFVRAQANVPVDEVRADGDELDRPILAKVKFGEKSCSIAAFSAQVVTTIVDERMIMTIPCTRTTMPTVSEKKTLPRNIEIRLFHLPCRVLSSKIISTWW